MGYLIPLFISLHKICLGGEVGLIFVAKPVLLIFYICGFLSFQITLLQMEHNFDIVSTVMPDLLNQVLFWSFRPLSHGGGFQVFYL